MKYFDDDMDELFNKAGRDYPLKTDPKNWDEVSGALYPGEAVPPPESKNGWRRYLPLLLLLLIPLGVYLFVDRSESATQSDASAVVSSTDKKVVSSSVTNEVTSATTSKAAPATSKISSANAPQGVLSDANQIQSSIAPQGNPSIAKQSIHSAKQKTSSSETQKTSLTAPQEVLSSAPKDKISSSSAQNVSNGTQNSFTNDVSQWTKFPPIAKLEKPEINIPIKQQTDLFESVPNTKKKNKYSNKTGFYYGVSAAPDISTIKGQEVKGTGYSAGIIAGYQLNAHWSVEAGVLWSRKKYFTDGKYFSKEGAQIPWSVDVMWLNGGCNMFEFPLLARYDFSAKRNTFFATAGLISYMMKTEDYKYGAKAGVSQIYYEGERKYERSGDHLFSNVQLSAGYKFSLSPKMNIRIEPYLKAPLKKIGIGKMPISSAGLSFGITRDFR